MDGAYDLDTLMSYLGDFGRYQFAQFCLHILGAFTAGMHMLSLITVAAVPEHRCEIPGVDINGTMSSLGKDELFLYIPKNELGEPHNCLIYNISTNESFLCSSWVYNSTYFPSSRAIEWNFVCDRRWMGAVAQMIYMIGVLIGAVILGNMADKYGRKPIFVWSGFLQLALGVGVAFTSDYYSFLIIRFLYGIFGSAGAFITGFVLTMELVGPNKRSACGIAFQAAFASGVILLSGWSYAIKDRQLLQIIYGLHSLLLIQHYWLMDESPRWLWANGRIREAVDIIKKGLKINKNPINLDYAEFVSKAGIVKERRITKEQLAGIWNLFLSSKLRLRTLNICLSWFANSLVYYGLSLNTGNLGGNPFIMIFLMALVELPSYVLTIYFMDKLGRRPLTAFNMIFGGVCCIIAANLSIGSIASIFFIIFGKFLIASSFAVIYNYSAELFPTTIRNSALGLGSMCARTSGALTPLITLLDSFDPKLPSIIFAIISILSGFFCLFLPETLNKDMPQTIEEGENFGIGDTFFTSFFIGNKLDKVPKKTTVVSEQMEPLGVIENE